MSPIQLYKRDPKTDEGKSLGTISESQLDFLIDNLEEEFEEDQEYFVSQDTVDYMRKQNADEDLMLRLEKALIGNQGSIEIFYKYE